MNVPPSRRFPTGLGPDSGRRRLDAAAGRCRLAFVAVALLAASHGAGQTHLPGTAFLEAQGDLAAQMVEGIHRYLDRAIVAAKADRGTRWNRDFASLDAYQRSVEPNRARLGSILGLSDERLEVRELELVATTAWPSKIAVGRGYSVHAVRWEVLPGVFGEGLLLEPDSAPVARVVALPDAGQSPEAVAGLTRMLPPEAQFARRLAESGCQVVVPVLIDRAARWTSLEGVRPSNLPHREFLYRMSYELGRHLVGYEIQKVLGAVDFFEAAESTGAAAPVAVIGYGEGGLVALHAAALDMRIDAVAVSGYFQEREGLWLETIDRNVWGLLLEFGDAEVASLVAPRTLIVEASKGPEVAGPPRPTGPGANRAASGRLVSPPLAAVRREAERARDLYERLAASGRLHVVAGHDLPGSDGTLQALLGRAPLSAPSGSPVVEGPLPNPVERMRRQFDQIVDFNHRLVRDAPLRRAEFWASADAASSEAWRRSTERHRAYLWEEVIGRLPDPDRPARPRSRRVYDHADFVGHEVVLDVWEDVFAHGILLVPKGIQPGERRPVVVAQHGLEGRPSDLADPEVDHRAYHRYGARLASEGFVVYAPQNPYIGRERFRQIQRKAHPLQLSLFSFILGQHQRTLEWLGGLPFVDSGRIGFYGLSYGGKTAVRVPPLLDGYALSICSADFNEWVWKNTSTTDRYSYLFTQEYDMLEFNFANVVNYAELATLMAPRPFMVERGHSDGVAPDEWVAYEFAKVRRFYNRMGLGDRVGIEFFDGPHEIHGVGTFRFLRRHLGLD